MSYTPVPITDFPGLKMPPKDHPVDGAVLATNCRVDDRKLLRGRNGYTVRKALTSPGTVQGVHEYLEANTAVVITSAGTHEVDVLNAETTWAKTGLTGSAVNVKFDSTTLGGGAGFPVMVLGRSTGRVQVYGGTGVVGDLPNAPWGRFVDLFPMQDRLAVAYAGNGSLDESRVYFSKPIDPLAAITWDISTTGDFVDLAAGDGEAIRGTASWRDLLFVFKETKYFVFYGVSTDSTGGALFNYRTINTGQGARLDNCVVAAADGVYFLGSDGIYRTTGDAPELVSGDLQGWFDRDTTTAMGESAANIERITANDREVWCILASNIAVYSLRTGQWTRYDLAHQPTAACGLKAGRGSMYLVGGGTLYEFATTATTDAGTAITQQYKTSHLDLGSTEEKVIRQVAFTGMGSFSAYLYEDWDESATATALALGSTVSRAVKRQAQRGRKFALYLTGTGGWSVNEMVLYLRDQRGER